MFSAITIAREFGSGGSAIARRVAERCVSFHLLVSKLRLAPQRASQSHRRHCRTLLQ